MTDENTDTNTTTELSVDVMTALSPPYSLFSRVNSKVMPPSLFVPRLKRRRGHYRVPLLRSGTRAECGTRDTEEAAEHTVLWLPK